MTTLPTRVQGSTLPDTTLFWREDNVYLDLSGYSAWQIEAHNINTTTVLWTKTSGFTGAAGSVTVPNLTIAWVSGDLGALTAGTYDLELTGTLGGKLRKLTIRIAITAEVA